MRGGHAAQRSHGYHQGELVLPAAAAATQRAFRDDALGASHPVPAVGAAQCAAAPINENVFTRETAVDPTVRHTRYAPVHAAQPAWSPKTVRGL